MADAGGKSYNFVMYTTKYDTTSSIGNRKPSAPSPSPSPSTKLLSSTEKAEPSFINAPTVGSSRKLVFHHLEFDKDTLKSYDKEKYTILPNPPAQKESNKQLPLPPSPISSHTTSPNKKAIDAAQVLLELNHK